MIGGMQTGYGYREAGRTENAFVRPRQNDIPVKPWNNSNKKDCHG
jgi:hypothetical protein